MTGLVAASWCVGIGLAVLITITLVGWIAAPRTALGPGLPGVFRTAVNFWLVAHHAGFSLDHGRVGLLPLGLTVLPGALLYRSGGWMIRAAQVPHRPRVGVVHVALALAIPYAVLAGVLALVARSTVVRPSAWQALLFCFLLATAAGGLGAARALVAARGKRVRSGVGALLRLLPDRPRSLVMGVIGSLAVLVATGAVLVGASMAMHMSEATALYDELAPGIIGGALLLLVELAFLPNAVIWGMSYAIGPGFAVGAGTSVSPTGVFLDVVPSFPPLAALPGAGPAPVLSLFALAAPFVAGAVGGVLTIRAMPSPVYEAAPLWGFLSGSLTGCVTALLAALAGGPLGGGRLSTMGPSAWQVGLMAALEVGISAAIAAWIVNWMILRRPAKPTPPPKPMPEAEEPGLATPSVPPRKPKPSPYLADPVEFEEAEPVLAPRRPPPRRTPRIEIPEPAPEPEPEPEPEPIPDTRWLDEEEAIIEDPRVVPEPRNVHEPRDVPEPRGEHDVPEAPRARDEPERTENNGGAIYVLREEQADD